MQTTDIVILENSIKYLRRNLIFPKKKEIDQLGIKFYLKFILLNLSTVMFLVGNILHLIVNINRKTYINMDLDLALAVSLTGSYYFNFSYLVQVKNVIKICKQLSNFHTYSIPDNFLTTNKKLNFFSKLHYVYIIGAVVGVSVAPLIEYKKCKRENMEKNIHEICGLIGGMWLPLNIDNAPYKQLYYLYQVYSSFVLYQTSSMISISIMETVEHLILRFRHIRNVFLDTLTERNCSVQREKFRKAVNYHVDMLELSQLINLTYNMCMFVHVLLTGAILGCLGYRLLKSYSLGAICLFVGWLVSMIIVCISGQRLRDESMFMKDVINKVDWLTLDRKLQKDLIIVMMRCQKPTYLHAGPFGYMTYAMIITVLKTSYSYLTLLSRTT